MKPHMKYQEIESLNCGTQPPPISANRGEQHQPATATSASLVGHRRSPKPAPEESFVATFKISASAYKAIQSTLGRFPAETGGLLLGDPVTGLIEHFLFDAAARTSGTIYYPTVEFLNDEIPKYEAKGIHAMGIAHSHPARLLRPSGPDLSAAYNNITSLFNTHLKTWHLPIIQSVSDTGNFSFLPYIVSCSEMGEPVLHRPQLEIV